MFYRREGEAIVYNGEGYMIFYVPEVYFTTKCAIVIGDYISILGVFNYSVFDNKGKNNGLKTFDFPSVFLTQPSEVEKVKKLKLAFNSDEQDYRLLKFKDGDKIIVQTTVPEDIENVEEFFQLFVISGNTPNTMSYLDLYKKPLDSIAYNGGSFNISNQFFGIMQSEMCRDPNDVSKPFRLSKAKKNKEWTNYKIVSIKDIPKFISPFVSITSENFDDSLVRATMIDEKDIKSTPLEKIFTGR